MHLWLLVGTVLFLKGLSGFNLSCTLLGSQVPSFSVAQCKGGKILKG